jgi:hypothetical protein
MMFVQICLFLAFELLPLFIYLGPQDHFAIHKLLSTFTIMIIHHMPLFAVTTDQEVRIIVHLAPFACLEGLDVFVLGLLLLLHIKICNYKLAIKHGVL